MNPVPSTSKTPVRQVHCMCNLTNCEGVPIVPRNDLSTSEIGTLHVPSCQL